MMRFNLYPLDKLNLTGYDRFGSVLAKCHPIPAAHLAQKIRQANMAAFYQLAVGIVVATSHSGALYPYRDLQTGEWQCDLLVEWAPS